MPRWGYDWGLQEIFHDSLNYIRIITSHYNIYKDPYQPISTMECHKSFDHCSCVSLPFNPSPPKIERLIVQRLRKPLVSLKFGPLIITLISEPGRYLRGWYQRLFQRTPISHTPGNPPFANYERNPSIPPFGKGFFGVCSSSVCWNNLWI